MQSVPLGTAALSNGPVTIILRLLSLGPAGVLARTLPDVPDICDGNSGSFIFFLFSNFFSTEKKFHEFVLAPWHVTIVAQWQLLFCNTHIKCICGIFDPKFRKGFILAVAGAKLEIRSSWFGNIFINSMTSDCTTGLFRFLLNSNQDSAGAGLSGTLYACQLSCRSKASWKFGQGEWNSGPDCWLFIKYWEHFLLANSSPYFPPNTLAALNTAWLFTFPLTPPPPQPHKVQTVHRSLKVPHPGFFRNYGPKNRRNPISRHLWRRKIQLTIQKRHIFKLVTLMYVACLKFCIDYFFFIPYLLFPCPDFPWRPPGASCALSPRVGQSACSGHISDSMVDWFQDHDPSTINHVFISPQVMQC